MEIKDIKTTSHGTTFTISHAGIEIIGCSYRHGEKDGKKYSFIAMPQRSFIGRDGKTVYVPVISLSRGLQHEALHAWLAMIETHEPGPQDDSYVPF
jgi:hypothetical protein